AFLIIVDLVILAGNYFVAFADDYFNSIAVFLTIGFLFLLVTLVLELQAVATMGLWLGLTTRRPAQAVTKTIVLVIGLRLLALPCYPIYPILALVKNLIFINYA